MAVEFSAGRNVDMKRFLTLVVCLTVFGSAAAFADDKKEDLAARGNNVFAFDIYEKLARREGNVFMSPLSISTALAMTAGGARGETAEQMAKVLHLPGDSQQLGEAVGELLRQLKASEKPDQFQLHLADALWGQKGFGFLHGFLELSKQQFGAELREVDFHDADAACKIINAWVEAQTQDKIKDLLQPGVVRPDTKLILTNAIYFKSAWSIPFTEKQTKEQPFHLSSGKSVQTPMMHQKAFFGYGEDADFQALELPYAGRQVSMVVLLPRKSDGLAKLEASFNSASLDKTLSSLKRSNVDVALPKFKIESEFRLRQILEELGMPLAFSRKADFTGMSASAEIFISDAIHKAYVDVNEKGTEAAAATAVVVMTMALAPAGRVVSFHADHPFLFVIRDQRTGSLLFQGRVMNPKG
jgi:serpin B